MLQIHQGFLPVLVSAISSILQLLNHPSSPEAEDNHCTDPLLHQRLATCMHLDEGVIPHICHKRSWRKFLNVFRGNTKRTKFTLQIPNKSFQKKIHDPKYTIPNSNTPSPIQNTPSQTPQMFCPNIRYLDSILWRRLLWRHLHVFYHLHKVIIFPSSGALNLFCIKCIFYISFFGGFRICSYSQLGFGC